MRLRTLSILFASAVLVCGCWGTRYVSADADLERIYAGKTYYEILAEFGQPDATLLNEMGGTKVAYNSVSLNGTLAGGLYHEFKMRNAVTYASGSPHGGITFIFNEDLKCTMIESDFEHERVKGAEPPKRVVVEPGKPIPVVPQIPRSIDYPYVETCSPYAEKVSIEKIEVQREYTKIYFSYNVRTPLKRPINDYGISISPEVYIVDRATRKRCKLLKNENIALYPESSHFAHNKGGYDILNYQLTFEALPESAEYIDVVEPGHSGFNFYNVDIRTPMTSKQELKQSINQK